jgi:lipopolysaccharide export system permease protein
MILHLYFGRRFLQIFGLLMLVFLALLMLLDLVEQMRRFADLDIGMDRIFGLTLLNAPGAIREILPLIVILTTITLFVSLARSSELVVTRASGRSGLRALIAPGAAATLIGVLSVTTLNPIVAATSSRSEQLTEIYRTGDAAALSISGEGLWLRQGSPQGQAVIHARRYNAETGALLDVTMLSYSAGGGPVRRIEAEGAELRGGYWELTLAKVWPLAAGLNPETSSATHETLRVPSTLTQDRIRSGIVSPTGVSIWELPRTIRELRQAGFTTKRHEVWLQIELARPIFLISMVLVAAAFTMRHTRFGGTGVAVLMSVLLGFGLFFVRNFAQILGENGQIPVSLAAWAPPIASFLLALGLLLHTEDG